MMTEKVYENATLIVPDSGPAGDLVRLSARYSTPNALEMWDRGNKHRVYTIRCREKNHTLAVVYWTKAGLMLDLPEAMLSRNICGHLVRQLVANEKAGRLPAWESDLPRVFFDNCSSVQLKRMCVPLYALTPEMLALPAPLACSCSWSSVLTFGDLAKGSGHKTLKNEYPEHKRRSTLDEITPFLMLPPLYQVRQELRAKGLPKSERDAYFTRFCDEHLESIKAEARHEAAKLFEHHWQTPFV